MPYLTNIYLLTDHERYSQREDKLCFIRGNICILSRLNLKAPPFESEHLFRPTRNVQWTCFRVLDLFQINAVFLRTYKTVISWIHGKNN
jgi:hypothetical protein